MYGTCVRTCLCGDDKWNIPSVRRTQKYPRFRSGSYPHTNKGTTLKTHIGVCQLARTLFTLRCLQTLYRPHSSQGVGSVQALKDAQRFVGRGNLFNLWLGPGMSTMRRHYKSRQHRLTLWQSVTATCKRASELPLETMATQLPGQRGGFYVRTIWFGHERGGRKSARLSVGFILCLSVQ